MGCKRVTDKWICKRCGREHPGKPEKNEICNADGCKGRFQQFHSCKICGAWFKAHGRTICPECAANGYKRSRGQYVCGMSVPPVMMANIATEVYQQWLKN